jgi:hypothetical protein
MHPAIYVIGFIVFAVLIVWLVRGARDEPEGGDDPTTRRWFHDGGDLGPGPGA